MTIRRRLFISNILMYVIPILLIIVAGVLTFVVYSSIFGFPAAPVNYERRGNFLAPVLSFSVILLVMLGTSMFLTRRVIKSIVTPLDVLAKGVQQIRDGNLSYRIEYVGNDEFAPVCADFNEMAERLNSMVDARQKESRNRQELIAGISHDLRTPLTSLVAYVEGLEKGVALTPEAEAKYLQTIKAKSSDLEHIINQLFLFSKMDIGEFPLHIEKIDVFSDLRGFVAENAMEYRDKGLQVGFVEEGGGGEVGDGGGGGAVGAARLAYADIDVTQFHNVIYNVLENSLKYKTDADARATIYCGVEAGEPGIVVRIADNGPGVDPETLANLFEIFYRGDSARNDPHQGSGIGLAIARKTIERFGGTIEAENVAGGDGAGGAGDGGGGRGDGAGGAAGGGGLAITIRLPEKHDD